MLENELRLRENFKIINGARLQIRYSIVPGRRGEIAGGSAVLWFFSLGAYPYRRTWDSIVRFDLYDRLNQQNIKSYSYKVKCTEFFGWLSLALGPVISVSSGLGIQEMILYQEENPKLEEKLIANLQKAIWTDLSNAQISKVLLSKEIVGLPTVAVLPIHIRPEENISEDLEQVFLKQGIPLVERKPEALKRILDQQIFENTGIVKEPSLIGKLLGAKILLSGNVERNKSEENLNLILHETESGRILWKKVVPLQIEISALKNRISNAISEASTFLRTR
ncbi:hypothetical protein [Leptospira andrefontaineae]|uniref:Uncharacterized protein n=1 Tax=Leptospira andrefontaineae TaxID=2484976 RepID=A0A4R9HCM9_9LEPT|nr:hypothetical protein [Leptospira andrefontaineae]TGK44596.1 hypothetical protein EHO65_00725 [Leptospira andrefontaineae]